MVKKIINHDYKCQICGKSATKSIGDSWHEFDIDKNGNFIEVNDWAGDTYEFYCDKCFKKEYE